MIEELISTATPALRVEQAIVSTAAEEFFDSESWLDESSGGFSDSQPEREPAAEFFLTENAESEDAFFDSERDIVDCEPDPEVPSAPRTGPQHEPLLEVPPTLGVEETIEVTTHDVRHIVTSPDVGTRVVVTDKADPSLKDPSQQDRKPCSEAADPSQEKTPDYSPEMLEKITVLEGKFPLHRAAYYNDYIELDVMFKRAEEEEKTSFDFCGNTVLHVAILRENIETIEILLGLGFPIDCKNRLGWRPLEEAIRTRNHGVVKAVHKILVDRGQQSFKAKKPKLLAALRSMPDFHVKVNWQFGSMLLSPLLKKFAPDDTYSIWKKGTSFRMDGTLMGMNEDEESQSMFNLWKRGHFSLLFSGENDASKFLMVDHEKKKAVDALVANKEEDNALDDDVEMLMFASTDKSKMRAQEFSFNPVKGWLGKEKLETVDGWKTKVYEATAKIAATTVVPRATFQTTGSFGEYLAGADKVEENEVVSVDLSMPKPNNNPESPPRNRAGPWKGSSSSFNLEGGESSKPKKQSKPRKVTARCWLAENFPLRVDQLLSLLDIMSHANKHFSKVQKYVQKCVDMGLFPVKIQVPLMMTVYALLCFRELKILNAPLADSFFDVPQGYTLVSLEEALEELNEELEANEEEEATKQMDEEASSLFSLLVSIDKEDVSTEENATVSATEEKDMAQLNK
ncbi:hypothetical protein CYMTET_20842 [Cymbomonas tetramitiformis]|uniref:Ankyrin repeat domain-containing protein n=1 Tax=Cymbomonas tetramitiformis TaxID=36881 RepID=A0AAE0G399_9CHLO|nr:hypothetical protein CYMTET_20842 [Cymbomonas tetramitiformis]